MMEDLLYLEPRAIYDSMIIGVAYHFNMICLAYDKDKIIEHLKNETLSMNENMDSNEALQIALEYFNFNILGASFSPCEPIYISMDEKDIIEQTSEIMTDDDDTGRS